MNNKVIRILPLIFLTAVMVSTPLPTYAKEYRSIVGMTSNLLNECSSEGGSTNCANNNAESYGDENNVSPQVTQSSLAGPSGPSLEQGDLIYTVAEDAISNIVFNRIGGLADPYNIELNNDLQDSERADVAVSGNNVYAVWDSDSSEILYRRSLDGGATFGDITILSDNLVDTNSQNPTIFADGNNVYIAWSDDSGILLRKSTDGGETYGPTILVSTRNTSQPSFIDLVVVGSTVYIVWSENITADEGGNEIFFSKSVDGGDTFSPKRNLSQNGGDSINPAMAVYRNKLHIVWADESSGNAEILYRRSLNGGETFGITKNLSNTPSTSLSPTIVVFRDRLYVTWSDNSAGLFEIVLIKSKNSGTTFDTIDTLSNNPGDSRLPKLAVSENNIYVVWAAPGGIFFIRSPDSGTIFGAATIIIPDANRPAIAVSQNIA